MKRNFPSKRYLRNVNDKVLILTNGKTEKVYLEALRKSCGSVYTIEILFVCADVLSLVNEAIKRKKVKQYNKVWVVFDIDNSLAEGKILPASEVAEKENIRIAYSNEAFEIWLMFHFKKNIGQPPRKDYVKTLNLLLSENKISVRYSKGKKVADTFEKYFIPELSTAVDNSKRTYEQRVIQSQRDSQETANVYHANIGARPMLDASEGSINTQSRPDYWNWKSTSNMHMLIEDIGLELRNK